jgi:hypothetical protein
MYLEIRNAATDLYFMSNARKMGSTNKSYFKIQSLVKSIRTK